LWRTAGHGTSPGIVEWSLLRDSLVNLAVCEPDPATIRQPSLVQARVPLERDGRNLADVLGALSQNGFAPRLTRLGERLDRWLMPCADDADLLASLQQHVAVDGFHADVKRADGTQLRVEISAAGDAESKPRFFGLLIRRAKGALVLPLGGDGQLPTHLVGKVPLREIVQTAIAAIERRCIEMALALARGNRTMAAETLGMSRQSLYTKLSLYSLDPEG
jgi:hypothetical protein